MPWKKVSCQVLYKDLKKCEDYFLENITDQICYYEVSSNTIHSEDDDLWVFEAYLKADHNIPDLSFLNITSITEELVTEESWRSFLDYQPEPIILKNFYIYKEFLALNNKMPILINSSMAFGTGEHKTTQGCLEAICNLKNHEIKSVLDIGTGSGILAMGAKKIFNCEVIGTDIDEDSVKIAQKHAQLNNCEVKFHNVVEFDQLYITKKFDLVIANIFANTIIELYDYIVAKEPKFIIMSGFFEEQIPEILEIYSLRYASLDVIKLNNWITLSLQYVKD